MIYYFSATGNSAWVAHTLAAATADQCEDMSTYLKSARQPAPLAPGERLGLVFPVHAWRPPRVVLNFLNQLPPPPAGCYVFAVCTMGGFAGDTFAFLRQFIRLDSCYSVLMPENYILLTGREPDSRLRRKITAAEALLPQIAAAILAGKKEFVVKRGLLAGFFTHCLGALFARRVNDRKFHTTAKCNGCGTCAGLCPLNNISLENGRPRWQGNCIHCMACLQRCPQQAIEYGKITLRRKRYVFPDSC
ncbi:MAG: 4Fe-4S binding protein [Oligosphaeraceae bacterium]|nr:4Fe-4S binding protein [Oligosphaeraceae bacterium]